MTIRWQPSLRGLKNSSRSAACMHQELTGSKHVTGYAAVQVGCAVGAVFQRMAPYRYCTVPAALLLPIMILMPSPACAEYEL